MRLRRRLLIGSLWALAACWLWPSLVQAQSLTEVDLLRARLAQLEMRARHYDALAAETARLHDDVGALAERLRQYESWPVRLPPVTHEAQPLPVPVERVVYQEQHPLELDVSTEAPMEERLEDEEASGYGGSYGSGFDLTFWGWLSYVCAPQSKFVTFWAWEAEFDVTKTFTENLAVGSDIDFVDWDGDASANIEQLFLSMMFPNFEDAIFTAGKFNAPFGIERRDFWDRQTASTSILFDTVLPLDMVGLMYTQPICGLDLIFRPFVINGIQQNIDLNQQPSLGIMSEYRPCDEFSLAHTFYWGPEIEGDNADKLHFNLAQAIWQITSRTSLSGEYLVGSTESPVGQLDWDGYTVIASQHFCDWWRVFGQWSELNDRDGYNTGLIQHLRQGSIGIAWYLQPRVEGRAEYRRDWSSEPIFDGGTGGDSYSAHFTFGF